MAFFLYDISGSFSGECSHGSIRAVGERGAERDVFKIVDYLMSERNFLKSLGVDIGDPTEGVEGK